MPTQPIDRDVSEIDAFVAAAGAGDLARVREMLRDGMPVDATIEELTALYAACYGSHVPVIEALLDAGANPNRRVVRDGSIYEDRCPLNCAIMHVSVPAIELLLDRGANPRVLDNKQSTAAHRLLHLVPAFMALPNGEAILNNLLTRFLALGVPVNQTDASGRTLLHLAAGTGKPQSVIRTILDHEADVLAYENRGHMPMHVAVEESRYEVARILLDYGVDPNVASRSGHAPLYYARDAKMAQMLIDRGADINTRDKMGMTLIAHRLLDMTRSPGLDLGPITGLLLDAGADLDLADFTGENSARQVIAQRLGKEQADRVNATIAARAARHAMGRVAGAARSRPCA